MMLNIMQTDAGPSSLRRKLVWLMGVRVAAVTIVLGTGLLAQIRYPGVWPIDPFFFLIGVTYALTVVYGLTLKYVDQYRWVVDVQLATDALIQFIASMKLAAPHDSGQREKAGDAIRDLRASFRMN